MAIDCRVTCGNLVSYLGFPHSRVLGPAGLSPKKVTSRKFLNQPTLVLLGCLMYVVGMHEDADPLKCQKWHFYNLSVEKKLGCLQLIHYTLCFSSLALPHATIT